ncbi:hypothetical protein [Mycolicibacterium sp. XJ870]
MTYPPSPPTGPNGPWQQPYPQQHGAPQQYHQPYGPPQYGPPPQPPYGAPQQPYSYGAPPPYQQPQPGGGNGKWLAVGGAILAVVLVAGIAIFAFTRDSESSSDTSNASDSSASSTGDTADDAESEIRQYIEDFEANPPETFRDMAGLVCRADEERVKSLPAYDDDLPLPGRAAEEDPLDIIDVAVTGNAAVVRGRERDKLIELHFRKEDGAWKMCTSDGPGR